MKNEVTFNPDERILLDWLNEKAKSDRALAVSDTALIQALGWDEKRFFVAKGHLLCAGALQMYRDGNGRQCLRLLMPEREHRASKRYVFTVVPLECVEKVRAMVTAERKKLLGQRTPHSSTLPLLRKPGSLPPSLPGKPNQEPSPHRRDLKKAQEQGMRGVGVAPAPQQKRPGPGFRPPIRRG